MRGTVANAAGLGGSHNGGARRETRLTLSCTALPPDSGGASAACATDDFLLDQEIGVCPPWNRLCPASASSGGCTPCGCWRGKTARPALLQTVARVRRASRFVSRIFRMSLSLAPTLQLAVSALLHSCPDENLRRGRMVASLWGTGWLPACRKAVNSVFQHLRVGASGCMGVMPQQRNIPVLWTAAGKVSQERPTGWLTFVSTAERKPMPALSKAAGKVSQQLSTDRLTFVSTPEGNPMPAFLKAAGKVSQLPSTDRLTLVSTLERNPVPAFVKAAEKVSQDAPMDAYICVVTGEEKTMSAPSRVVGKNFQPPLACAFTVVATQEKNPMPVSSQAVGKRFQPPLACAFTAVAIQEKDPMSVLLRAAVNVLYNWAI